MSGWQDKVALVTGGRSGIGAAISAGLAGRGVRVLTAQRGEDPNYESIMPALLTRKSRCPARVITSAMTCSGLAAS
ncbi:MAG: SDR family NAD(P)-dependent oxidoreductase, partial [Pseudomonadota bacterium]